MRLFAVMLLILHFPVPHARFVSGGSGYLGVGYNLLIANNDGIRFTSGGPDPGLLSTRIILRKTLPLDSQGLCPLEAVCSEIAANVMDDQYSVIADMLQYQLLFSSAWKFDSTEELTPLESTLGGVLSPAISEAKQILENSSTLVIDKRKITTVSQSRYNYKQNHALTDEFALELCDLPADYDADTYKVFVQTWGTHVIVGLDAGVVDVTRYEVTSRLLNSLVIQNPDLSKMLKLNSATSTVSYDSTVFQDEKIVQALIDVAEADPKVKKWQFSSGSLQAPAPIVLTLKPIADFIQPANFDGSNISCPNGSWNVMALHENLKTALQDYPAFFPLPTFTTVQHSFRLGWPKGSYALIKTINCPETFPSQVWTGAGKRTLFDAMVLFNDKLPDTEFSVSLTPTRKGYSNLAMEFCTKLTDTTDGTHNWPMGSYCLFKKGNCPPDFEPGSLKIPSVRATTQNDALPDGTYNIVSSTFEFCCRNDRPVDQPTVLPTFSTFSLLPTSEHCQSVKGMSSTLRSQSFRTGSTNGTHPYVIMSPATATMKLHFCLYQRHSVDEEI